MKKRMVTLIGLSVLVLLMIGGCGADAEGCLDDFFGEYYSECIQLCETCAEWTEMCNIKDTVEECTKRQWYRGLRNLDCTGYIKEINLLISQEKCNTTSDRCLLKDKN